MERAKNALLLRLIALYGAVAACAAALLLDPALPAQQVPPGEDFAMRLRDHVVKITVVWADGSTHHGFGFVVGGEDDGTAYIATADHVVRGELQGEIADRVAITWFRRQGQEFPAELLGTRDDPRDVAVLRAELPAGLRLRPDLMQRTAGVPERGAPVWYVGRSGDWYVPSRPGTVNSVDLDERIVIDGLNVQVGTSGAPLVASDGIAGMIVSDEVGGVSRAIAIDFIERAFRYWAHPWGLRRAEPPAPPASAGEPAERPGGNGEPGATTAGASGTCPRSVRVPDVRGLAPDVAERALGRVCLALGAVSRSPSDDAPAGTVIAQNPAPGEAASQETAVDVVLAEARPRAAAPAQEPAFGRTTPGPRTVPPPEAGSPALKVVFSPGQVRRAVQADLAHYDPAALAAAGGEVDPQTPSSAAPPPGILAPKLAIAYPEVVFAGPRALRVSGEVSLEGLALGTVSATVTPRAADLFDVSVDFAARQWTATDGDCAISVQRDQPLSLVWDGSIAAFSELRAAFAPVEVACPDATAVAAQVRIEGALAEGSDGLWHGDLGVVIEHLTSWQAGGADAPVKTDWLELRFTFKGVDLGRRARALSALPPHYWPRRIPLVGVPFDLVAAGNGALDPGAVQQYLGSVDVSAVVQGLRLFLEDGPDPVLVEMDGGSLEIRTRPLRDPGAARRRQPRLFGSVDGSAAVRGLRLLVPNEGAEQVLLEMGGGSLEVRSEPVPVLAYRHDGLSLQGAGIGLPSGLAIDAQLAQALGDGVTGVLSSPNAEEAMLSHLREHGPATFRAVGSTPQSSAEASGRIWVDPGSGAPLAAAALVSDDPTGFLLESLLRDVAQQSDAAALRAAVEETILSITNLQTTESGAFRHLFDVRIDFGSEALSVNGVSGDEIKLIMNEACQRYGC